MTSLTKMTYKLSNIEALCRLVTIILMTIKKTIYTKRKDTFYSSAGWLRGWVTMLLRLVVGYQYYCRHNCVKS